MSENQTTHTINAIRAGVTVKREIAKAKAEAERLRKEAAAADKHLSSFAKQSRDEARAHARRCQIVGEVFLDLASDNPIMWTDFRDHLEVALGAAADADRALFSLAPLPKTPVATTHAPHNGEAQTSEDTSEDHGQPAGERRDVSEASEGAGKE